MKIHFVYMVQAQIYKKMARNDHLEVGEAMGITGEVI